MIVGVEKRSGQSGVSFPSNVLIVKRLDTIVADIVMIERSRSIIVGMVLMLCVG